MAFHRPSTSFYQVLESIPALRAIVNATLYAVKDLGSTLLIILFFTFLFGIFLNS